MQGDAGNVGDVGDTIRDASNAEDTAGEACEAIAQAFEALGLSTAKIFYINEAVRRSGCEQCKSMVSL